MCCVHSENADASLCAHTYVKIANYYACIVSMLSSSFYARFGASIISTGLAADLPDTDEEWHTRMVVQACTNCSTMDVVCKELKCLDNLLSFSGNLQCRRLYLTSSMVVLQPDVCFLGKVAGQPG